MASIAAFNWLFYIICLKQRCTLNKILKGRRTLTYFRHNDQQMFRSYWPMFLLENIYMSIILCHTSTTILVELQYILIWIMLHSFILLSKYIIDIQKHRCSELLPWGRLLQSMYWDWFTLSGIVLSGTFTQQ